jgi:hypothetical protein
VGVMADGSGVGHRVPRGRRGSRWMAIIPDSRDPGRRTASARVRQRTKPTDLDTRLVGADDGEAARRAATVRGDIVRRALVAMAAGLVVLGCSGDPYPLPSGPPHAGQLNPASVGHPSHAVLIYLTVRPGDRIELVGADAVGALDGATVRFLLSRPVVQADGVHVIGERFEDLPGAVVTAVTASPGPDNEFGIAAELTAQRPGRFEISNVRLRYRLNGSSEQVGEGIDVVWTVCADDPAPTDCPEQPGS